jgi:LEA14-like dessication related protein
MSVRPRRAAPLARLLALAAALASASLLPGCAIFGRSALQSPDVTVTGVSPIGSSGLETRVRVGLRLSNSNEVPLEIDGLRFQLDLNGEPFARGRSSEQLTVPRLGDAELSVEVFTTAGDLLRQLGALDRGGNFAYRISGDLFLKSPQTRTLPFRDASE